MITSGEWCWGTSFYHKESHYGFLFFQVSNFILQSAFYIEPLFRKKGFARKLAEAAQSWCNANDLASLTVTCAPCDEGMYKALGFDACLGKTFAYLR